MAKTLKEEIAHLLGRAGFGATPAEIDAYAQLGYEGAVSRLVNYWSVPDTVDSLIGTAGYANVLPTAQMSTYRPNYVLTHARSRWLFRMLYTQRPLQEKMALFWHNHFATQWSKIAGIIEQSEATRLMATVPTEDPGKQWGQVELFRSMALGYFSDLLLAVTRDPAMLFFLDGRLNVKATPQENYGREVMELFTFGLTYTEADVKAAARVFTGWNLQTQQVTTITIGTNSYPLRQYNYFYNAGQHDTDSKSFSFPIYDNGSKTIPARTSTQGVADGLDFLNALIAHPGTATLMATKLYTFFVNDAVAPDASAVATIAGWLTSSRFNMGSVMSQLLVSDFFRDPANYGTHYKWPVEYVIGTMRALGPGTNALSSYLDLLGQMGEDLFEPPNVAGYPAGPTWISSGTLLSRANFAYNIVLNDQNDLVNAVTAQGLQAKPDGIVDYFLDVFGIASPDPGIRNDLIQYVNTGVGNRWSGSVTQLRAKVPGLVRMIAGIGDYAFN